MAQLKKIIGFCRMKCPVCSEGDVFVNKSIFPLNKCQILVDKCGVCGQSMKHENNKGAGINYALTIFAFFLGIILYGLIFGLSYKDNSFFYCIIAGVAMAIALQPWLMRISKLAYLYIFIK